MPNKFEVLDHKGRLITCTDERWQHIISNRHFMSTYVAKVKSALEKPTCRRRDADYPNREVFYRLYKTKKQFMKVVVEFDGDAGRVITAHPASSYKKGEIELWKI